MRYYTHYTTEKRKMSRVQLAGMLAITRKLNRPPSTVCCEIGRNQKADGTYSANYACKQYAKRRRICGRKPILAVGEAGEYVMFS